MGLLSLVPFKTACRLPSLFFELQIAYVGKHMMTSTSLKARIYLHVACRTWPLPHGPMAIYSLIYSSRDAKAKMQQVQVFGHRRHLVLAVRDKGTSVQQLISSEVPLV